LAGFILIVVIASGQVVLGIGAVVVASIVLELLTWRGIFGRGSKTDKRRRSDGPRLLSGV
jgi:hypothetical protein